MPARANLSKLSCVKGKVHQPCTVWFQGAMLAPSRARKARIFPMFTLVALGPKPQVHHAKEPRGEPLRGAKQVDILLCKIVRLWP